MQALLTSLRIHRESRDDSDLYWCNLLYDMMQGLTRVAREYSWRALDDIRAYDANDNPETIQTLAYFAGVNARKAFSIASRVLELDEERRSHGGYPVKNWENL